MIEPTRPRRVSDSAAGTVTVQCWFVMVRSAPVMTGLNALAVTTNVRMFGSGDAGLRHDPEYCWVPSTSVWGVVVVVVGAAVVVVVASAVVVVVVGSTAIWADASAATVVGASATWVVGATVVGASAAEA